MTGLTLPSTAIAMLVYVFALAFLLRSVTAQACNNNVAAYHPNERTAAQNSTWFILEVPKSAVLAALKASNLTQDLTLMDAPGFSTDVQPVLVNTSLQNDIRMSVLQIAGELLTASVYATYVSKPGVSGPLAAPLSAYIGGPDNNALNIGGVVPALVSTAVGGESLRLGFFNPATQAWNDIGGGIYEAEAKWTVVPNPISGPGIYIEAIDATFTSTTAARYQLDAFKQLINQPIVLTTPGMCQRNQVYFNNATALPALRTANVTLGSGADGVGLTTGSLMMAAPDGNGMYPNVGGLSACGQVVGYNAESCASAVANVDQTAL